MFDAKPYCSGATLASSEGRVCRSFVYFVLPFISGSFEAAGCALKAVAGLL
jgi:hypothetical protein